jgi:hypothetical protein
MVYKYWKLHGIYAVSMPGLRGPGEATGSFRVWHLADLQW